jgi:DNA-binding PadR family transcriptional regulator
MTKLGLIDLEILFLGIKNKGSFNEKDIENSELKRLGVGRILDSLASLKDRKLLTLNNDGTFSITDLAKHTLWSEQIPTSVKILRLLEIKSFDIETISNFLRKPEDELIEEIEKLRKKQLVLMSPLRQESRLVKMYEILPEGVEEIKKIEEFGLDNNFEENTKKEIFELINELVEEINNESVEDDKKKKIILKLEKIKEKLSLG